MKLKLNKGKFEIEPNNITFDQLLQLDAMIGQIALVDIGSEMDTRFHLIDGDLYGCHCRTSEHDVWWYYDPSIRLWSRCDDPCKAVTKLT